MADVNELNAEIIRSTLSSPDRNEIDLEKALTSEESVSRVRIISYTPNWIYSDVSHMVMAVNVGIKPDDILYNTNSKIECLFGGMEITTIRDSRNILHMTIPRRIGNQDVLFCLRHQGTRVSELKEFNYRKFPGEEDVTVEVIPSKSGDPFRYEHLPSSSSS